MTVRQPRRRSTSGARCQFPGCAARAGASHKAAVVTVSGRPITVERLCADHRRALETRAVSANRARDAEPARPDAYRCLGCNTDYAHLATAERCADSHAGAARIAVRLQRKADR